MRRARLARAIAAALAASAVAAPTKARDSFKEKVEEMIVTATKRERRPRETPLAITALSGSFTREANLSDVKDLIAFAPGVSGDSQDSFLDAVSIRGVRTQDFGVGGDPSAAIFKNDLYEGRNGAAVASLYDLERAEIVRGPQGFLFGRNAIGGALSVHTRKAEPAAGASGYAELDLGERDHLVFEGAVGAPLSDAIAARLAVYHAQEDGFVKNFADGDDLIAHNTDALRLSAAYRGKALRIDAMAEYEDRERSGSVYRAVERGETFANLNRRLHGIDLRLRGGRRDADVDRSFGDKDDARIFTAAAGVAYDLDWMVASAAVGYKDHDFFYTEDYDGAPLNLSNYSQDQRGDYFQQEARLTSAHAGPLSWYVGASFYEEDIDAEFANSGAEDLFCNYYGNAEYDAPIADCPSYYAAYNQAEGADEVFTPSSDGLLTEPGRVRGKYQGWAAYVELDYALTERIDIGGGLRRTEDKKEFKINAPQPESQFGPLFAYGFTTDGDIAGRGDWSDTQARLTARYRPRDGQMLFASYTEGFKAGGFGSFALVDAAGRRIGCDDDGCPTALSQEQGVRPRAFRPEAIESWEWGYKGRLLAGRVEASVSGFVYDYEDLQISFYDEDSGANTVENIGHVDGAGIEAEIKARWGEHGSLYISGGWLRTAADGLRAVCDARDADGGRDRDGCEGRRLYWAPKWTGAAVARDGFPLWGGVVTGALEVFWESARGGGWGDFPETRIKAHAEAALRLGYESAGNWRVNFYVENLTDSFTYDGQNNNGGIQPAHFFGPRRPRTFGGMIAYTWN